MGFSNNRNFPISRHIGRKKKNVAFDQYLARKYWLLRHISIKTLVFSKNISIHTISSEDTISVFPGKASLALKPSTDESHLNMLTSLKNIQAPMSQIFVCDDHKGEMCGLGEVLEHLRKKHVSFLKRRHSLKSPNDSAISWYCLNCSSKSGYDTRRFKSNQDTWNHLCSSRYTGDLELSKIKLLSEKLDNDEKEMFLMEFPGSK